MLKKVNFDSDESQATSDDEEPLFCDPNFEDVELEVVVAGPAFVGRRGLRIPTSVAGDLQECELVGLKSVLFVQTMWSPPLHASRRETVSQHRARIAACVRATPPQNAREVGRAMACRAPPAKLAGLLFGSAESGRPMPDLSGVWQV